MKKALEKKLVHRFVDLIDETSDSQTDQLTFSFSSETPVKAFGLIISIKCLTFINLKK